METASRGTHDEGTPSFETGNFSTRSALAEGERSKRLSTGVTQLDEIMQGGYIPRRSYLIRGDPGAGKTTVGLHFLIAGAARGELALCITIGETEEQIHQDAASIGLSLEKVAFLDLSRYPEFLTEMENSFEPQEHVHEKPSMAEMIMQQIRELKPQRVFLDSMTQLRLVAPDSFQLRKQVLTLLRFLMEQEATVLFTSESIDDAAENDLLVVCDGVINLRSAKMGQTVSITKFRGSDFSRGEHDMKLSSDGLHVFPHSLPPAIDVDFGHEVIASGIPELDDLLHGGLSRGTITIITGPSGVGKTTLGLQFMKEMAASDKHSAIYIFEEWERVLVNRCESIGIPIRTMIELGTLSINQIEPLRYRPDEFAFKVRSAVERQKTSIVMIDSISGYGLSIHAEDLVRHLHALCKYLQGLGIAVLLINETEKISTNEFRATDLGISYVADNIIFLRYFERSGGMRKSIGVLKKRLTDFEPLMREIEITRSGLKVGKPLTDMKDILRIPYLESGVASLS